MFVLFSVCFVVVFSSTGSHQCGTNEVPSNTKGAKFGKIVIEDEKCQHVSTLACDSCKDCSICLCKQGYIRAASGRKCITESACQKLHIKWLDEAKKFGTNSFADINLHTVPTIIDLITS